MLETTVEMQMYGLKDTLAMHEIVFGQFSLFLFGKKESSAVFRKKNFTCIMFFPSINVVINLKVTDYTLLYADVVK
jgi:hypothetical protein